MCVFQPRFFLSLILVDVLMHIRQYNGFWNSIYSHFSCVSHRSGKISSRYTFIFVSQLWQSNINMFAYIECKSAHDVLVRIQIRGIVRTNISCKIYILSLEPLCLTCFPREKCVRIYISQCAFSFGIWISSYGAWSFQRLGMHRQHRQRKHLKRL